MRAQLLDRLLHVPAPGGQAHAQLGRDLLGGQPLRGQCQSLQLAGRQPSAIGLHLQPLSFPRPHLRSRYTSGWHDRNPPRRLPHRVCDVGRRLALEQVPAGARLQRRQERAVALVTGHEDDCGLG